MLKEPVSRDHQYWRSRASQVRIETGLFVDGVYRPGSSGDIFENHNPATGALLSEMAVATAEDVDGAVQAARRTFRSGCWSGLVPRERTRVLYRFADLVEAHSDDLAVLESIDMGKPVSRVLAADLPSVVGCIRYYAECIDKLEGKVTNTAASAFHYILREPLGVVAAITPWNFPMLMAIWKVAPALAAGNTVVLKPAEQAPLSCLRLAELFVEAGGPPGAFNVVNGPGDVTGKALALHPDVAKIGFTGSTEVGRLMLVYAGQSNLKRVSLECGGKSPQIILADTPDLEAAAKAAVAGIYGNSGQVCTAGSRLLVDRAVHRDFVELFLAEARRAFRPGDPLDPETTLGPMVSRAQRDRVLGFIDRGRGEGARLRLGGGVPVDFGQGAYLSPTLFDEVAPQMTIAREEIFGPVAAVIPVDGADDAVRIANDSIYGLAASVWTRDLGTAHRLIRELEAGIVWANCYSEGDMTQSFGGYKQSGQGRDCGFESLLSYTQTKSAWIKL